MWIKKSENTKQIVDSMEPDDHKIEQIVQQHARKVDIDDDLTDLFDKQEILLLIIVVVDTTLVGIVEILNDDIFIFISFKKA